MVCLQYKINAIITDDSTGNLMSQPVTSDSRVSIYGDLKLNVTFEVCILLWD